MNFLQLVNLARSEAGAAGGVLTTLQGVQTLETNRFISWVNTEWQMLQSEHPDFQFLRQTSQFTCTPEQAMYTPQQACATVDGTINTAANMADWKHDSFRISTAGQNYADEQIVGFMIWDQYRNLYQYGQMRFQYSRPVVITIDPQKNLWLGKSPDQQYVTVYEYYQVPQSLLLDTDTPIMPARFHPLIAYRALRAYGQYMYAPEVLQRANAVISKMNADLCNDQLPAIMDGPPLVN